MKTISKIIALFILCNNVSEAQFTFSVVPRTFTDEINVSRTVTGIQAKIISTIDINLTDTGFSRVFYVAFVLESGKVFREFNASTNEFITRAVDTGIPEATAKTNVINICRLLEYGTKQEKYAAAQQLAAIYGYILKPLNEQE